MIRALLTVIIFFPVMAFSAEISPVAKQEIKHLLGYMKGSGCEFNRNGTWYNAPEAVNHLNNKYEYLLKKRLISSTEDFIKQAATKSSISGKPYQVRCAPNGPVQSSFWFNTELGKYRAGRR